MGFSGNFDSASAKIKDSILDFRIDSNQITLELAHFIQAGNGLLTGDPGVGKSYELNKLVKHLQKDRNVVLFLPIDKLVAETDVELQDELGLKTNLFEYIKSEDQVSPSKKGIIIIDAFDAARSREKRSFYIKIIRRIVSRLSEEWNILVAVRLFDAKKSSELLDIFTCRPDKENSKSFPVTILKISKDIPCRHVILPELNSNDLSHVVSKHPILSKYEREFNPRLKKLLLNPFYITLILLLIENDKDSIKINSVYSEVQLLDLYWRSRIESNYSSLIYERLLTRITKKMVKLHSLSLNVSQLKKVDEPNISFLLSAGILARVGINKNKISYSHNILFDYAVSRYVIEDDKDGLFKFILADKSRIVLLKPSIRYYLTKCWYLDKTAFKKICLKLYEANASDIPLIAKIMTTQVIVRESDALSDQDFICNLYEKNDNYREWLHATIVSCLESVENEGLTGGLNTKFWVDYFEKVVQNSSNPNEFNVIGWLYQLQNQDKTSEIQNQIGRISRKILAECLSLRHKVKDIDRFASHLPIVLVIRTYGTDIIHSRESLQKIFEIAGEENFDLSYLSSIGYEIKEIFPYDLELVSRFYQYIFSTTEDSTKLTELGNAGSFRLTSNRRQDFESIRYHLGQESEALIDSDLTKGLEILLSSINQSICRTYIRPYLKKGYSIQDLFITFQFSNQNSRFLSDSCYIWGDSFFQMQPEAKIISVIENKILELSKYPDKKIQLKIALNQYGNTAIVAILWRDLVKTVSLNPAAFDTILVDLICAKPLQVYSETLHELAALIDVSLPYLSSSEIDKIILSLIKNFEEIDNVDNKKYLLDYRNFLLSKIPSEYLPTKELKSEIDKYLQENATPPHKPIEFSKTEIGYASEEDILEIRGIDREGNEEIISKISMVKTFNDKWINEEISEVDASTILMPLIELYSSIEDQEVKFSQNIIDYSWDEIARCAKIITRGLKSPDSELFNISRKILLKAVALNISRKDIVDQYPPDYDSSFWSPTPLTDAAEGLLRLYSIKDDETIWGCIEDLSHNKSPLVRSIIVIDLIFIFNNHPNHFWKLIDEFIENENNYKIHEFICINLRRVYLHNLECRPEVEKRLESLLAKSKKIDPKGSKILENTCFIIFVGHLAFVKKIIWGRLFFEDVVRRKEMFSAIRPRIVMLIIDEYFKSPRIFKNDFDTARNSISRWLNKLLLEILYEIQELLQPESEMFNDDKILFENLYGVIDQYITRFYFVLDKKYNGINNPEDQTRAVNRIYGLENKTISLILDSLLKMDEKRIALRAQEMQYLMGILNACLDHNPKNVLEQTLKALKLGHRIGYSSNYLGKEEIQRFIDHFIADHRDILEEKSVMDTFTELLDNYALGYDPEAIKFIMSLDLEYN
jgi:hypothetical protein